MIRTCSVCKRIYGIKRPFWPWSKLIARTDGYCPACFREEFARLEGQAEKRKRDAGRKDWGSRV